MRLDKYLKVSRLIKRRTLANEVADAGRVMVNDKPAKASYAVKVGDHLRQPPCQSAGAGRRGAERQGCRPRIV